MSLDGVDILFIENVGNLVCPANFDLGQHRNGILLSVTKGDDKPAKYPVMFRAADLLLITKTDLLPVLDDFSTVFELSARKHIGLASWLQWLRGELSAQRARQRRCRPVRAAFGTVITPLGLLGLLHAAHTTGVGTQTQK